MDADQLVFGDKKEMNVSKSDYFMLHSMISEKDSECQLQSFATAGR